MRSGFRHLGDRRADRVRRRAPGHDPNQPPITPREYGLLIGVLYARIDTRDTRAADSQGFARLDDLARGDVPEELRRYLMLDLPDLQARLDEADSPDAAAEFWEGFGYGIRAYLSDVPDRPRPN
jgi:hypothetical protein